MSLKTFTYLFEIIEDYRIQIKELKEEKKEITNRLLLKIQKHLSLEDKNKKVLLNHNRSLSRQVEDLKHIKIEYELLFVDKKQKERTISNLKQTVEKQSKRIKELKPF